MSQKKPARTNPHHIMAGYLKQMRFSSSHFQDLACIFMSILHCMIDSFFFGTHKVSRHCIGTFLGFQPARFESSSIQAHSCLFAANPVAPPAADPLRATPSPRLRASSPSREDEDGPGDVGSPFPTRE